MRTNNESRRRSIHVKARGDRRGVVPYIITMKSVWKLYIIRSMERH